MHLKTAIEQRLRVPSAASREIERAATLADQRQEPQDPGGRPLFTFR